MKNRFIVVYTIFATAVFIFSMGFFGYNLYHEYSTNLEKSETQFSELTNNIRTLSYSQEENTPSYAQGIKNAIGEAADYSFIQVRRNNETVVLYPTGKSREETVSRLTKSFSTSLTVNKQSVAIDCNLYLIRPDSIFYYARISFLMILIITIITIIMIIYLNLTESSSDVISLEEGEEPQEEAEIAAEETEESEEIETDDEEAEVEKSAETEERHEEIPNFYSEDDLGEDDIDIDEEEDETQAESESPVEEEKHAEVTPEEVKAILSEPLTDEQAVAAEPAKLPLDEVGPAPLEQNALASPDSDSDQPSGLFNPDTGIGWESYLNTRLNNEIERATASEIDLSLFIIKLPDLPKTSEVFRNVCNYLGIQFQFKDLLFEHKDDCIVAIKISMNVDEALTLADKLYADICNIVNNNSPRIGISSRSIRMVSGDRLILEAEQAIEHTDAASPVIAFRVDSEKYRQLMEQNQN